MRCNSLLILSLAIIASARSEKCKNPGAKRCADGVYILKARGSNEKFYDNRLNYLAAEIKNNVTGSFIEELRYPAKILSYSSSVTAGIKRMHARITDYVENCGSSSRIVLLGYSQGGQIVTGKDSV